MSNYKYVIVISLLVLSLGALYALRISDTESNYNQKQAEVADRKDSWIKEDMDNIGYTIWRGCMFSSSHDVIKTNGVASFSNIVGNRKVKNLEQIEDIFDEIIRAYKVAKDVEVKWDKLGYPAAVSIDWSAAIDDECSIVIKNFRNIDKKT